MTRTTSVALLERFRGKVVRGFPIKETRKKDSNAIPDSVETGMALDLATPVKKDHFDRRRSPMLSIRLNRLFQLEGCVELGDRICKIKFLHRSHLTRHPINRRLEELTFRIALFRLFC